MPFDSLIQTYSNFRNCRALKRRPFKAKGTLVQFLCLRHNHFPATDFFLLHCFARIFAEVLVYRARVHGDRAHSYCCCYWYTARQTDTLTEQEEERKKIRSLGFPSKHSITPLRTCFIRMFFIYCQLKREEKIPVLLSLEWFWIGNEFFADYKIQNTRCRRFLLGLNRWT